MSFRPLRDKILVRPDEHDRVSRGGIHIPETARDMKRATCTGVIVSLADGWSCPHCQGELRMELKAGDRVVYARHATRNERTLEGDVVHMLRYEHILGVIE